VRGCCLPQSAIVRIFQERVRPDPPRSPKRNGPPVTSRKGRPNVKFKSSPRTPDQARIAQEAYRVGDLPAKIAARIVVDPVSGCWLGEPPLTRDGYARLGNQMLHRAVWAELVSPIPAGKVLDHREDWGCTSRACCYPGHLRPCTNRENVLRGRSFAAVNWAKDRCDNGHPFDLLNTYYRPNGHRDCRACVRDRVKRYKHRLQRSRRSDLARAA